MHTLITLTVSGRSIHTLWILSPQNHRRIFIGFYVTDQQKMALKLYFMLVLIPKSLSKFFVQPHFAPFLGKVEPHDELSDPLLIGNGKKHS